MMIGKHVSSLIANKKMNFWHCHCWGKFYVTVKFHF